MSKDLEEAERYLQAAKNHAPVEERELNLWKANVSAQIAQAKALERIADFFEEHYT